MEKIINLDTLELISRPNLGLFRRNAYIRKGEETQMSTYYRIDLFSGSNVVEDPFNHTRWKRGAMTAFLCEQFDKRGMDTTINVASFESNGIIVIDMRAFTVKFSTDIKKGTFKICEIRSQYNVDSRLDVVIERGEKATKNLKSLTKIMEVASKNYNKAMAKYGK